MAKSQSPGKSKSRSFIQKLVGASGGKVLPSGEEINNEEVPLSTYAGEDTSQLLPLVPCPSHVAQDGCVSATQLLNCMNDGQKSPYIFDPTFLLLIDTRDRQQYDVKHIVTAMHVSFLDGAASTDMYQLEEYTVVVLYDDKGLSQSLTNSELSRIQARLCEQDVESFILTGGYDDFDTRYPFMCTAHLVSSERDRQQQIGNYPSVILQDQLYLGRGDQANSSRVITNLGITHIVNATTEHPCAFSDKVQYLPVLIEDEHTSNLLREFPRINAFIHAALQAGGRVLVHCNLGVSRSSTVVIAYLMASRHWSLIEAHRYVRDNRPIVHPNRGFTLQLAKYEELVLGRKLSCAQELW